MIVMCVLLIALMCCSNFGRAFPANIILLSLITIAMSLMLGPICSCAIQVRTLIIVISESL